MSFKCPDCGASLTDDSRFCKYCGAKIDDGVKRSEIKIDINKRVEDVAELKRAEYEERESAMRVERMQREATQQKAKRIVSLVLLIILGVPGLIAIAVNANGSFGVYGAFSAVGATAVAAFIIVQLLKGKW